MDIKKVGSLHSRGTIFQYFCQGESHSSKLMIRQGNVNKQVADVCKHRPRQVRVAYDQMVKVNTYHANTMVKRTSEEFWNGYIHEEILSSFLLSHNLIPTWHGVHGSSSFFDEDTGLWTGVIGLVSLVKKRKRCLMHFVLHFCLAF